MNRFLAATFGICFVVASQQAASGADMPVKAPVRAQPVIASLYDWSGFYLGVHAGGAWGDKDWSFEPNGVNVGSHSVDGFLAGGQFGFNVQVNRLVFGVEAQASWLNAEGSHVFALNPTVTFHSKVSAIGTIAGRIGYAWDRTLLYAKAGGAWARDKFWNVDGAIITGTTTHSPWGWMVGGGLEYGFTANWSGKIEYNYLDFGTIRHAETPANVWNVDQRMHVVKAGINYRFAPTAVVARY